MGCGQKAAADEEDVRESYVDKEYAKARVVLKFDELLMLLSLASMAKIPVDRLRHEAKLLKNYEKLKDDYQVKSETAKRFAREEGYKKYKEAGGWLSK